MTDEDTLKHYGTCPICGGKLCSDGEWVTCDSCEQEWHDEDFYFKFLAKKNT